MFSNIMKTNFLLNIFAGSVIKLCLNSVIRIIFKALRAFTL